MFAALRIKQSFILLACALILASILGATAVHAAPQNAQNSSVQTARLAQSYGNLPLSFEANQGQIDSQVKFMSKGSGYGIYLTSDKAVIALNKEKCGGQQAPAAKLAESARGHAGCVQDKALVSMELAGNAKATANPAGEGLLPGTANYFVGSDQSAWRTGVPTYARVRYGEVYPGVDLVYYGNQRQLEYDFAVAPNADPTAIRLQFSGVTKVKIDGDGNLILSAQSGDIAFRKPVIYQERNGHRDLVAGRFTLGKRHTVGFALNEYDHSKPLIIDPVLAYATYLGGSGSDGDMATAIAVDSSGDAYITGQTDSSNFPLTSASYQQADEATSSTAYNAFVTKLNAAGTELIYSTYLGGSGNTGATGIAVDSSGDAYVTGHTFAGNFPTTSGAFQTTSAASSTDYVAFVSKLNPAGTSLVYSTFLGGSGNGSGTGDTANGIAVDSSNNAYVAGLTYSANFPVTSGAFQTTNQAAANAISGGFVTKLNAAGTALDYSTFLSGSGSGHDGIGDVAYAIAVDTSGDAYVTGSTGSSNFPTKTGAYLTTNPAAAKTQTAAFVAKLNPAGTALLYSTFLGGSENASGSAIAVNASGDAYVAGYAMFTDFPVTTGAFQTTNNASAESTTNAFVAELNATGTGLVYSTWLGGSGAAINADVHSGDSADAIAVDASGDAYVTGTAFSTNFPVSSGAVQPNNEAAGANASNAFVTELNPTGAALVYSSYLGGSGYPYGNRGYYHGDDAMGLALDSSNNVYVAGAAYSINFPVTNTAFQTSNSAAGTSGSNAFVAKVSMASLVATTTTVTSSANPATAGATVTFTADVDAASGSTLPAGSVTFVVDGSTASTVTLGATGTATFATSSLAAGTHSITASYAGSSSFSASAGNGLTQTISEPVTAAPVFSPAVGTYTAAQSVKLSDATSGATIYYTTNGATPTTSSTKYSAAFSVSATETIKAIAVATGDTNSVVASGTYAITPVAATPTFSVAAGSYSSIQSITLSDATSGATIYYTTNGATPTTSSTKYSGAISVSATETIEAIAVGSGYTNSAVASAKYTISLTAATPTFSVAAGTYATTQSVTIADATSGATIYYTTNGTTPTTSSTKYSAAISVSATETIEAIAVATGSANSAVASAKYTISLTAATPTFSVAAGTYASTQSVTVADATSGATIYYTTNGATPTTSSTKYTGAISVSATETIEAIAVATGDANSGVASAKYTISLTAATPTFSVAAGTYSTRQSVIIADATSGATIYYTTNGATPTTSSTKYSKPIRVSATETIEAIAVATGYNTSSTASAKYTIE
jgi:hypothetical protein